MDLYAIAISQPTAPLDLRQRFACPAARQADLGGERPGLAAYAILSTCNRLEVYAWGERLALISLLEELGGLPLQEFSAHLCEYQGLAAVEHLCRVACGLESMMLGEAQILGQVAAAAEMARQHGRLGTLLAEIFRLAVRAGKRARTETAIGRNPTSISSLAVALAEQASGGLNETNAVVIGAGEMATLAAQALYDHHAQQITIVNRTVEHALSLAGRVQGQAWPLERLDEALNAADIVIACSGAPHVVITPELARRASLERRRPLVFVDIAVPRNISQEVAGVSNIIYYDLDTLQMAQNEAFALRQETVPQVEAIVATQLAAYEQWQRQQAVIPLVAGLHGQAKRICKAEIERSLRNWPHAGEEERQRLEALTEAVIKRFLHTATHNLKNAESDQARHYAATMAALFGVNDGHQPPSACFSGR